jgi:hypothetical protein
LPVASLLVVELGSADPRVGLDRTKQWPFVFA